jgi:hypothetical protein
VLSCIYDGTSWSPVASGITADLNAVWGSSSTNIFAAGQSGTIIHYDGSSWSVMASGTTADIYGIWGQIAQISLPWAIRETLYTTMARRGLLLPAVLRLTCMTLGSR